MKRPLAYITAGWLGGDSENAEQAARYCRAVYEAGFSPICPTLYLPLFLNDAVPEEHKSGIDMSRDLLRRSHVLVVCGHTMTEAMKNDIAVAQRLGITATRNFWDVPLPLPELWEAVKWAVKPEGAVLFFAQCPYDKVLGASNLSMLRYEWIWYKERGTGFLNANRAPLKKSENILVFYQKAPLYNPQFTYGKPYSRVHARSGTSPNYGKFERQSSESSDGRRYPGNVLFVPTVTGGIHPTQKPVELCEYFIKTYTRPGELVADICAGSGTTAVAALNAGRRFVCFETAPAFYAAASERIRVARSAVEAGEKGV